MENDLTESILRVCSVLNKHSVDYLLVGGTAVALHGYFRYSVNSAGVAADKPDVDVWYNPTYGNYFKLLDALAELGQNVTKFKNEQAPIPKTSFFKYEFESFTLDLLPALKSAMPFNAAFAKKEHVVFAEVTIPFIGYDDLLHDKATNARAKDITDIEQLKNRRQAEQ
ncbi:hypothetical protein MON38_05570 [Hymenobacter sp. DH14]|uniref:Nucleotidyltransferase n=1 Tax=Hymenobacter cyanobacteriorum TaxID=2926463 RepID=A0A9X2AGZ8_9BACT|nr:hypothetical protein [Hymenobacter cyanobacteriorum]MCI1186880.1 hypothetical protein [Hymenobacter cyanobacteriorum]